MGKRDLDKLLLEWILDSREEEVTFVGPGDRNFLVNRVRGLGIKVHVVDSDPKYTDPSDAVFDSVNFSPLVVVFNAEKHYPIGKLTSRKIIVVGDNDQHNGDCNPISSCSQLVEQNNFQYVKDYRELHKWFLAYGESYVRS